MFVLNHFPSISYQISPFYHRTQNLSLKCTSTFMESNEDDNDVNVAAGVSHTINFLIMTSSKGQGVSFPNICQINRTNLWKCEGF